MADVRVECKSAMKTVGFKSNMVLFGSKMLVDSGNVHVLYIWRSNLTGKWKIGKSL
jgi:hypothetical protein